MSSTKDKSDLTTSDGYISSSSTSGSNANYQETIISEVDLVGVLPPQEDNDFDDVDDYIPSEKTESRNFPDGIAKAKTKEVTKPEKQKNKDHNSVKHKDTDSALKVISDPIEESLGKQTFEKDTVGDTGTKIIEDNFSKKLNDEKDIVGDDTSTNEDDDDGTRYARSVSFCGKKMAGLAQMAAETKNEAPRTEKRTSQWEQLMRKFSEAHKEECRTVSLDIPRAQRSVKQFPTGSMYEGTWDLLGMSGFGTYTFPNGVVYVGDFEDGMFHGEGELRYPEGAILRGTWKKGHMVDKTLIFADGLEYNEYNWGYCKMPDRRFTIEYENGLQPSGRSYLTADQPTRVIPNGYYDTGDGFYDPKTKIVYSADDITSIVRSAGPLEAKWIVDNCRTSPEEAVGPRQELYEEWSEPQTDPEPPPPPAVPTRTCRRDTDFSKDLSFDNDVFYEILLKSRTSCAQSRLSSLKFGQGGKKSQRFRWQD